PRGAVTLVGGRRLRARGLAGEARAALASLVASGQPVSATRTTRLGGREWIAAEFPLSPTRQVDTSGHLVLLADWAPTERYLDELRRQLVETGLAIFGVALVGGLLFARRVSGPLKAIASAAREIASGNWNRQVPVRGSAEGIVMARAVNSMTTSLRHWYEEVKRRDDRLREAQKMEAIGRLAGGIAHDFNNLLTSIRGYAELLLLRLKPRERLRDEVQEILSAADRAAELTKQLLAFSRRRTVVPRVLALDRLVASAEGMLRSVVREDVQLVLSIEPDVDRVRADRGQIEQVLLNLVVNAR